MRPLASVTGVPLEKLRGLTGRLARENSQRRPGRTAATAAALMIGLALVTFVTVFAAGLKGSIASAVDRNFQGELVIQNTDGFSPIPAAAAPPRRARVRGVGTVSTLRSTAGRDRGDRQEPGLRPRPRHRQPGADARLEAGLAADPARPRRRPRLILDDAFASDNGLEVGDPVTDADQDRAIAPRSGSRGTVTDDADLLGSVVVTQAAMRRDFGTTQDQFDFVKLAPGADADAVQVAAQGRPAKHLPHGAGAEPGRS